MPEEFLSISKDYWEIIFMILRYGFAVLAVTYLTFVFVKQKNNLIDIKGQILEERIDSYQEIHHHVMRLRSLIASPYQEEHFYQYCLSLSKIKTGFQGLEYCSFFHTPAKLVQFGLDTNQLVKKSTIHLDYVLEQKLKEFQWWMDDVITIMQAFITSEADKQWKRKENKIEQNSELACRLFGIALQHDLNAFYQQFDYMLRNRLQKIRLSSIRSNSLMIRIKHRLADYCEKEFDKKEVPFLRWFYNTFLYPTYGRSQLRRQPNMLLTLATLSHFSDEIKTQSFKKQSMDSFTRQMSDYQKCYNANVKKAYEYLYD